MALRIAFIGFRHAHIVSMYRHVAGRSDCTIVAACEEDAPTRATLPEQDIKITHDSYVAMLRETECDVIACGDYFGVRGARLLAALEKGCHVISDKPICTSVAELDGIKALSGTRGLRVGCMLDLRDAGPYIKLRELLHDGVIGEVHTISFWAQHPLLYGKRPMWNFESGKHGGTINDLGIHAVDAIPWLTGRRITEITAARAWNAHIKEHPDFQDGAALMLKLDNNGMVMGDLSYLSSDQHGYTMDPYWRFTISGDGGVVETAGNAKTVTVWLSNSKDVVREPVAQSRPGGYFEDFLADLNGRPAPAGLCTQNVLENTRIALLAQRAADNQQAFVKV